MSQNTLPNPLDLAKLRAEFPLINQGPFSYLDNAATTQKPQIVIDTINYYYQTYNANVHRGAHQLSDQATEAFEQARKTLQQFINAHSWREIIWTKGATEAINLIASSWGHVNIHAGDTIVISAMEHHANIVPWQQLALRNKASLEIVTLTDNGDLDLESYDRALAKKPKLVALTHISNVLGTLNPVKELTTLAHEAGAVVVIDGAQAIGHEMVDVQNIGCDFYVASAHKAYGPTGIGFLYGKQELLNDMPPWQFGGEMIEKVSFETTSFNVSPFKFEAGTPAIAGSLGFASALNFLQSQPLEQLHQNEQNCVNRLLNGLKSIPALNVVGDPKHRRGLVAFTMDNIHSYDVGQMLNQQHIAVRTGHHCAMPLMDLLGIKHGCVRASFGIYNTLEEVDNLLEAIEFIANPTTAAASSIYAINADHSKPLRDELKQLNSWQDKLNCLTNRAKTNPATTLADSHKTPENLLHGCTSQVWLLHQFNPNDNSLIFTLDSNSKIIKGLAALILEAVNGKSPQEISQLDIEEVFIAVGLKQHLSPSRSNGLSAIADAIKQTTGAFL